MNVISKIKYDFNNSSDLIIKNFNNTYIIYLESICDSDKINEYISKDLVLSNKMNVNNILSGPNTIKIRIDEINFYLLNGFSIVINKNIYAIETRGNLFRSVEKADVEVAIYGPKDSFNESIQINLGLIKRRIKSTNLVTKDFLLGKLTLQKISILYLDNICDKNIVKKIESKINSISVDAIISIDNLKQLLTNENKTPLPTIIETQRPDYASMALLNGKVVILADNSPFCLILPSFLSDFINPSVDMYSKSINTNFLKIIRLFCLLFTLCAPALYVSLINFNSELLPLSLLTNISMQRDGVPFPASVEAFIMLIVCAIIRESDIRFPSSYGSAISIVGALILGEAAVSAGIFSPIMIIVIAFTFITSMVFTDNEFISGIRLFRFLLLILASLFGLYGFFIGIIIFLIHIFRLKVFNINYTFPIIPFSKIYFNKILFRKSQKDDNKKDPILTKENKI